MLEALLLFCEDGAHAIRSVVGGTVRKGPLSGTFVLETPPIDFSRQNQTRLWQQTSLMYINKTFSATNNSCT